MNIIITSGAMSEPIDTVRSITNFSSGKLGAKIADTILKTIDKVEKLFYIGQKQVKEPQTHKKIERIVVKGSDDLLSQLESIFSKYKIDAIIHSAAIGDYKTDYLITAETLAKEIEKKVKTDCSFESILNAILNPKQKIDLTKKTSSYEKNLFIKLKPTIKVIRKIKDLSPLTTLIGFKLLTNVSNEDLFTAGYDLLIKNNADYVIANDLTRISGENHFALVIDKNGISKTCNTKTEIAKKIVKILK